MILSKTNCELQNTILYVVSGKTYCWKCNYTQSSPVIACTRLYKVQVTDTTTAHDCATRPVRHNSVPHTPATVFPVTALTIPERAARHETLGAARTLAETAGPVERCHRGAARLPALVLILRQSDGRLLVRRPLTRHHQCHLARL